MLKIQIPEPCHEDWNKMTPTIKGAYCSACAKEVVDFTHMSDEAVQHYFLNKTDGNTCGRFRHEQLHRIRIHLPETVFIQKTAGWKKYMAVLLLAFGSLLFGCDVEIKQETEGKAALSNIIKKAVEKNDKRFNPRAYVGGLSFTYDSLYLTKDFSNKMNYATYGFTVTVSDTTDNSPLTDTLQLNTDTTFIATSDTLFASTIVPADTLAKKSVVDSSGCEGIGFY